MPYQKRGKEGVTDEEKNDAVDFYPYFSEGQKEFLCRNAMFPQVSAGEYLCNVLSKAVPGSLQLYVWRGI